MRKVKTYLCGPIGLTPSGLVGKRCVQWRDWLTEELAKIDIGTLNPLDNEGNKLKEVRKAMIDASNTGDMELLSSLIKEFIIPDDLEMVEKCDFITIWIPKRVDHDFNYQYLRLISEDKYAVEEYISNHVYEICGSYGEITLAFWLKKPVYIVTERELKPVTVAHWAVGCAEKVFSSWIEYLEYINKRWKK